MSMTLDEAIEIKTKVINLEMLCWMPRALEADKLALEALVRIKRQRSDLEPVERKLLPGETGGRRRKGW